MKLLKDFNPTLWKRRQNRITLIMLLKKIKAFYHYLKAWELRYPKQESSKDDPYKGLIHYSVENMKNKKKNTFPIIEEQFLKAIKFYPEYFIFREDYALFLRDVGKYDEAEENFLEAIQLASEEEKEYSAYSLIGMYKNFKKEEDLIRIADFLEKKGIFIRRTATILIEYYEKKKNIDAVLEIIDKYSAKLDDNWFFRQKIKFLKEKGEESKILTEIDEWLLNLDSKTKQIQRYPSSIEYFFDKIEFISNIMIKNNTTLPRTINLLLQSIQPVLSEEMNFIEFCWKIGEDDSGSEKFGILLLKIGICYYRTGEIDKSNEFLTKGLDILQESEHFDSDYLDEDSLEFYDNAIEISNKLKN